MMATATRFSAVLIGGDIAWRRYLSGVLRDCGAEVTEESDDLTAADIAIFDTGLDAGAALAELELISSRHATLTTVVYSQQCDPELLVRAMRAGAREVFTEPLSPAMLYEAMQRARARRIESSGKDDALGTLSVFFGAKGGAGTTTVATSFAMALQQESGASVALADCNVHLGDVAVALGLTPRFTIVDALENEDRLDWDLLSSMLVEQRPGFQVLAAPDQYTPLAVISRSALRKVVSILRNRFAHVVVDGGLLLGAGAEILLDNGGTVYLVTQSEIPALRNAQRLLAHLLSGTNAKRHVEVILNRHDPRRSGITDEHIGRALNVPARWKVASDYAGVSRALNTGDPGLLEALPALRPMRDMARAACGQPQQTGRKRKWGLF